MNVEKLLRIFHWIVFGNYWVSTGVVALYAVSCAVLGAAFSWEWSAALFSGTLSAYTYHRVGLSINPQTDSAGGQRRKWISENSRALRFQMVASGLLALALFIWLCNVDQWIFLFPAVLVTGIYILPIIPFGTKRLRLRELPYVKILFIVSVWLVLSLLPLVPEIIPLPQNNSLQLLLLQRLLFLLAVTIPFDLRDMEFDRSRGIKTLATRLGAERSIRLSHLLLVLSAIVCWTGFQMQLWNGAIALALAVSSASTAILLARIKPNSDEMTFSFWIEGSMLDQLFWVQMFV
ncbi:MAG: UbiA family prenyltransferase [Bacteroidia bacterium]|jgi:4-hydroxybenzoate polyprenyltransferase